jgi:hypothetical protein
MYTDPEQTFPVYSGSEVKSLNLRGTEASPDMVFKIFKYMVNLEKLTLALSEPHGKTIFMKLLGDKNKKLKKLYIKSDSGATPYESNITDEDVLYVMQNTKLEELKMQQAANVGGRLFHTMGEYCQQLKTLNITREYHNGDLGPQDEVYFGPVVMPNMREISLNGHWDGLKQNFVDTMITAMPNLKIVHLDDLRGETKSQPDYSMLVEALDLEEFHYNYQSRYYSEKNEVDPELRKRFNIALKKKKNLRVLNMGGDDALIFTLEDLKNMHMPKLRCWCGPISQDLEYLDAFHNAFPNLTLIDAFFVEQVKTKDKKPEKTDGKEGEFFNDPNHWPDLRYLSLTVNKELFNLSNRPYVMNGPTNRQYGREQKPPTRDEYIRDCLKSSGKTL